jgi:hypothetical protein
MLCSFLMSPCSLQPILHISSLILSPCSIRLRVKKYADYDAYCYVIASVPPSLIVSYFVYTSIPVCASSIRCLPSTCYTECPRNPSAMTSQQNSVLPFILRTLFDPFSCLPRSRLNVIGAVPDSCSEILNICLDFLATLYS